MGREPRTRAQDDASAQVSSEAGRGTGHRWRMLPMAHQASGGWWDAQYQEPTWMHAPNLCSRKKKGHREKGSSQNMFVGMVKGAAGSGP